MELPLPEDCPRLPAVMAGRGVLEPGAKRIMSESTREKIHANPKMARDDAFDVKAISPTNFTQGRVNIFKVLESDHRYYQDKAKLRSGYVGWLGLGGAVMQWHPELNIGFAFTMDLVAWHDATNSSAARLQAEAANCPKRAQN